MAKWVQHSFGSGEVSPQFTGRSDKPQYQNACTILENYVITHHAAIESRGGLRFVAEAKDSSKQVRLVKFQFSTQQSYIIEVGHLYMRFYKDGGRIEAGGVPVEISTPYTETDIFDLHFARSADTMYIFHPSHAIRKLIRTAHTNWSLRLVHFNPPATIESQDKHNATLTLGALTGNAVSVVASAATFPAASIGREIVSGNGRGVIRTWTSTTTISIAITDDFSTLTLTPGNWYLTGSPNTTLTPNIAGPEQAVITLTAALASFTSLDDNKYVYLNNGIVEVIEVVSDTVLRGVILRKLNNTTPAAGGTWTIEEAAWSSVHGFPKTGNFFDGRLVIANTNTQPQTIWGSALDDYENFGRGTLDTEGYEFTIASSLIDAIQWLVPIKNLFIGTFGGVLQMQGGSAGPVTPTNVNVKGESAVGTDSKQPERVGNAIVYVNRSRSRIYELGFNFDIDGFISQDMTLLSEHLGMNFSFVDMAYQENPWSTIYVVRSDGTLCAMTYLRTQDLVGWSRLVTGDGSPNNFGKVESVEVVPHWTRPEDSVWVVVARPINGIMKRYIEYLDRTISTDSALTRSGAPVSVVSGLAHLEGKTVDVVGDDAVQTQKVVSGGSVTLDTPASNVEVGLHFTATAQPLPLASAQPGVEIAGTMKHWTHLYARFYNTNAAVVNFHEVIFRKITDPIGKPIPRYTGNKLLMNSGVSEEATLTIQRTKPLSQTILYFGGRVDISDL